MTADNLTHRIIIGTFCVVMVTVFGTLCYGLFDAKVDNTEIFKMMGHAFDMILVALTGYMGGRASRPGGEDESRT